MIKIRAATRADEEAIWKIFHAVIAAGDAYYFDPKMSREDAMAFWYGPGAQVYVAENEGAIVGSYIFQANRPGLGSHVSNAAFMVSPESRGLGVGRQMGEHCLVEAKKAGFTAMQFNFVISTNEPAVKLWKQLGFRIVGTLPKAFRHLQKGFVDVYLMFREL